MVPLIKHLIIRYKIIKTESGNFLEKPCSSPFVAFCAVMLCFFGCLWELRTQVGDWGRNGGLNQSAVADAMAQKAEQFHPDFVISVGDNFYESADCLKMKCSKLLTLE